jgi:hypothetical protein
MIALDGVYIVGKSGKAKFHTVKAPNQTELRKLLDRVIQRVVRRLERDGLLIPDPEQPWLDLDFHDPIDSLSAASIRYRIAIGLILAAAPSRYMTHRLSERTKPPKFSPRIGMVFHSMPPCHVSPISGIDWNDYADISPDLPFAWSDSQSGRMARSNIS